MKLDVRPARVEEIGPLVDVLRTTGLGANVGRLLRYPIESPTGDVLAAVAGDEVVGGAAVAGFGTTGWIGALGVASRVRRRGIGTALTEACVARLHELGARTVLLFATPAGLPVYRRVGFEPDGLVHAWRDVAPPRGRVGGEGVRALVPADLDVVCRIDSAATGEDRAAVFHAMNGTLAGLVVERAGQVAGSAVRSPWGLGPSVVATDREAGVALLSVLRRVPGAPLTVSLPDANADAVRALRAWGFQAINGATRMRLGPGPRFDPTKVFGMFNLFWG
jgi:N-acetylglutamate synthase-like GNAT family acetyltransferase